MSDNQTSQKEKPTYEQIYACGFEFGRSEELQKVIRNPPVGTGIDGDNVDMAHAVHCAAALAGLATKIGDLMGEENAFYALQQAANAVTVHFARKREIATAN
ncbi:MAG: hypothetical protein FJX45_19060 [Alphaproteobacteria bacterium]|nr:hypothetical protein [Alphaproteobacteria bacterium]MBM3655018.1 hypothetical protein [Alphaproteobacteria bacterium]